MAELDYINKVSELWGKLRRAELPNPVYFDKAMEYWDRLKNAELPHQDPPWYFAAMILKHNFPIMFILLLILLAYVYYTLAAYFGGPPGVPRIESGVAKRSLMLFIDDLNILDDYLGRNIVRLRDSVVRKGENLLKSATHLGTRNLNRVVDRIYRIEYGIGFAAVFVWESILRVLNYLHVLRVETWEKLGLSHYLQSSYQRLDEYSNGRPSTFFGFLTDTLWGGVKKTVLLTSATVLDTLVDVFFFVVGGTLQSIGFAFGWTFSVFPKLFPLLGFLTVLVLVLQSTRFISRTVSNTLPNSVGTVHSILTWKPVVWTFFFALGFCPPIRDLVVEQSRILSEGTYLSLFAALAIHKGLKVVFHTIVYIFFSYPAKPPLNPTVTPNDVTVIIPTTSKFGERFKFSVKSILTNSPAKIIVATVGYARYNEAVEVCKELSPKIMIVATKSTNKREQFILPANLVSTGITCYADGRVSWPSTYLKSALAPFEDPIVGMVGTMKRILRDRRGSITDNFLNYIACIYFERDNFESTATYNIDGGVSNISGRTAFVRTGIVQSFEFQQKFLTETFAWGIVGPLESDGDNFITRYMVNQGFKTVFHNAEPALIQTMINTSGGLLKFSGQLLKVARTNWRSHLSALFVDRACWTATPWTTYAVFLSSFTNFALVYDPLLAFTLYKATGTEYFGVFFVLLLLSKLIKPFSHLERNPADIPFFFGGVVFGYFHSLIKIWGLITLVKHE